jgi:hypothetical protein
LFCFNFLRNSKVDFGIVAFIIIELLKENKER